MICASLAPRTREQALAEMDEARRAGADLAEIRGDALADPAELPEIVRRKSLPVVATFRPSPHLSEDDRFRMLEAACAAGADFVDVEHEAFREFPRGGAKLLLSFHDFDRTPPDLEEIAREMRRRSPFLLKIAVRANGAADLLRCVRLQKSMSVPSAVIAMGEYGEPSRILYRRLGGYLTYAALRAGAETAPGQPTVADLAAGPFQEVYAVVGRPVAHSKSPDLFNAAFRAIGRNARYLRLLLDDPALFHDLAVQLGLDGASVTIPHKEAIDVDDRDEAAREIGALNTVVVRDGRFMGYNTDAEAALDALGPVGGKRALVLGAGGAARAIVWGLRRGGASVVVANRTPERACALGCETLAWERRGDAGAEIVVNATSVGMGADESPFPVAGWRRGMLAFDVVYTPRDTRFLREARAAGARTVEGIEMFLRQADRQFRLFTGAPMPVEVVREFR